MIQAKKYFLANGSPTFSYCHFNNPVHWIYWWTVKQGKDYIFSRKGFVVLNPRHGVVRIGLPFSWEWLQPICANLMKAIDFFISTQFWLFYCNLQIQAGHIWLLWGILVVIFPAEWFILCSKVSAAAGETFSWWLCSCRLPQAAIASSFFKPRALLPPRSTHLLEQFHAIKVPHHAHCTSTPIPIGFFFNKIGFFLG